MKDLAPFRCPREILLEEIPKFLARHNMTKTRFSLSAAGYWDFLDRLRDGKEVRSDTFRRVTGFMQVVDLMAAEEARKRVVAAE